VPGAFNVDDYLVTCRYSKSSTAGATDRVGKVRQSLVFSSSLHSNPNSTSVATVKITRGEGGIDPRVGGYCMYT